MNRSRYSFIRIAPALVLLAVLFFSTQPSSISAQGSSVRFFDDFEEGTGGWNLDTGNTGQSFWHLVTNPQDIAVHTSISPKLVSLPDAGHLPGAYSGTNVMWFGQDSTGTFIGDDFTTIDQESDNGGLSTREQKGCLASPGIDLSDAEKAYVEFKTWWEIEGKDTPAYDLMTVELIWLEGNATIATLNPVNDVDGEAYRPYSSGGLGQIGQWRTVRVDLSAYAQRELHVVFCFDSIDKRFNGFRGWLIDDVRVVATELVAPEIESVEPAFARSGSFVTLLGRNFVSGATVTVGGETASLVSVVSTEEIQVRLPTLSLSEHQIVVTNPDGKSANAKVNVTNTPSPAIESVDPRTGSDEQVTRITITGRNFKTGAKGYVGVVELTNVTITPEESMTTRSAQALDPRRSERRESTLASTLAGDLAAGLAGGFQNVSVVNPDGQRALLQGGYFVEAVINPSTLTVNGQTVSPGANGVATVRTGLGRTIRVNVPTDCGVDSEGNPRKVVSVTVTHGGVSTPLTGSSSGGVWSGTIIARGGAIDARVVCEDKNGARSTSNKQIGAVELIDPSGFIYDDSTGGESTGLRVEGATVVLYHKHPDLGDIVWDAKKYDQIAPQTTNDEGRYGWDVPAGDYFIRITHSCYVDKESRVVTVPPPVLDLNVGITPNGTCPPLVSSSSSLFLPLASLPVAESRLENGGFESGSTIWDEFSFLEYQIIVDSFGPDDITPRTGEWLAWLGGDDFELSLIEQEVTVGVEASTLSYWEWISSDDECGFDFADVYVDDDLVESYSLCFANNSDAWTERRIDLSAYAGTVVTIQIGVDTDDSLVSSLFVDDVALVAARPNNDSKR